MNRETVVITGANRGLGLGLTRAYLEDGWRVIALNRSSSPELESLRNDSLEIHCCDLTDDSHLERFAGSLNGQVIDLLINNAGRMAKDGSVNAGESVQGFGYFNRELWRDVFDINVFTAMSLSELLADAIARSARGRIVTISSMLGSMALNSSGGLYAYRATKAGVNAIMKSMSIDLSGRGIIAIAQHPGWVQTDMGGQGADIDIATSVNGMKAVFDGLRPEDSGKFLSWDGSEMPW
ncbi:MAG: SDR family oxidoreductase [Xanthomonadales bacterium]|nr:SDR family oxidoreductase [Gammaproteobacteria bacterium]NND56989.1 SDR family oxidoreductase [Xanthomonadales bacterium]NNK51947.1 SDR family oxidoreductase [Xanthomonadales bacterium]